MRHQELKNLQAFDVVDAPAQSASPYARNSVSAPAVPDMPRAVGIFLIASYAALMSAFAFTIQGARADFAILMGAFYVAMFFGIPAVLVAVENGRERRPDLLEFLEQGIDTATGRISGAGALVQMLIVPVLLAFAILAMGITYLLV